jgi:hypothetical protein
MRIGLATCSVAFDEALGVDARQMKAAHEGVLQVQRAFEAYRSGAESMEWDARRKDMALVRGHVLHLVAPLVPTAKFLGVDRIGSSRRRSSEPPAPEGFHLSQVTSHLYMDVCLLAAVLGNRYTREGQPDTHATVEAAKGQYKRCVQELSSMLTVALLIVALHGKVPCATGEAHWSAVRAAVGERLHSFAHHIRGSRDKFAGAMVGAVEALLEAPLRVVGHASWSAAELAAGGCRAEVRQALLVSGSPAQLREFVSTVASKADLGPALAAGLVHRGLSDEACDAVLACETEVTKASFYELWDSVFRQSPDAGMRFALRCVARRRSIHRPENDRLDPHFSAR